MCSLNDREQADLLLWKSDIDHIPMALTTSQLIQYTHNNTTILRRVGYIECSLYSPSLSSPIFSHRIPQLNPLIYQFDATTIYSSVVLTCITQSDSNTSTFIRFHKRNYFSTTSALNHSYTPHHTHIIRLVHLPLADFYMDKRN